MSILRRNDNPAQGRRVLIEQESLKVGYRGNGTYYNGTLNVDVREDDEIPAILNAIDDTVSGTQSFVYAQKWSGNDYPSFTLRHFLRLFSVRKHISKIFAEPDRYEVWVNNIRLVKYSSDVSSIVWRANWGEQVGDEFYVNAMAKIEGYKSIPTAFNIEARSHNFNFPPNKISFLIKDGKSNNIMLLALIIFIQGTRQVVELVRPNYLSPLGVYQINYPGSQALIDYAFGMQSMETWDMVSYKGKKVREFVGSVITLKKVSKKIITDYIEALG